MKTKLLAAATALVVSGMAGAAHADVAILGESGSYTLSVDGSSTGLGLPGPFGTVKLLELTSNSVQFTVDLNDPTFQFKDSGNNHHAFAFNLAGAALTSSNIAFNSPAGGAAGTGLFSFGPTSANESPFGSFGYSIDFDANPNSANFAGPLVFTLTRSSGIDLAQFSANTVGGKQIYFSADVRNTTNGLTGNVGAVLTAVPEPATWAMMILGLGTVGAVMRRRRGLIAAA